MSQMGQKLRFESRPVTSGLPPTPDISLHSLTDAMCQYWSSRLESIGRQGLFDRGRRQESDKLLGGVNLLAVRDDPRHIQRIVLNFGRQRDGLDTGHKAQIARHADAK